MKKLFFIIANLFISLNLAYANDLLFKASNGALNQNSAGVKKLNDNEMAQVKGGLVYSDKLFQYTSINNQGHTILTYHITVSLDQNEQRMQSISFNNGVSDYENYKSFISYERGGTPIIHIRHNQTLGDDTVAFAFKDDLTIYFIADKLGRGIVSDYTNRTRY